METKELLKPRFEVIADYPAMERNGNYQIGDILTDDGKTAVLKQDGTPVFACDWEKYPHLFRKMNWWEKRTSEQMPKKVKSLADAKGDVYEIEEWDMEIMVGWIDKKNRSCCSLLTFKPEYGYVPID